MEHLRALRILGCIAAVAGAATGCVHIPVVTAEVSDKAIVPEEGMAALAVIQPRTRFKGLALFDQSGRLLGQINGPSFTVIQLPPGRFRLYVARFESFEQSDLGGDRVEGVLSEGKTYFATISIRGAGIRMNALTPSSPDQRWQLREAWLQACPRIQMDPDLIEGYEAWLGDPRTKIPEIDSFFAGLNEAHLAARTIRAEDGI